MDTKPSIIAAIDLGTNSFHIIIASVNNRRMLQVLSREKEVVRLGSGAADMKHLQPEAIERGVQTMKNFVALARSLNARIRAVATSAVREALNKEEFLEKVKNLTNVDVEVVSGTEEGRLIYIGCIHALPIYSTQTLVIDIGGGSTETIIGLAGEAKLVASAKLGAIRLTKRFFPKDTITESQVEECRSFIKGEWSPIINRIKEIGFDENVVGTSGTIQNIAAMVLTARNELVPELLNGISITKKELFAAINKIIKARTLKKRLQIPGMDQERADIILGGALILEHFLISLNISKIVLSAYALREGIVFDTVQKLEDIEQYKHLTHLRYNTVYNLCHQYHVNLVHAELIKSVSLKIFDDLISIHKLGYAERELLETAALLHDVGYHISHDQHHRHSYYIISNCIMPGFTNDEADIIANIARYHRKSHPKPKHENLAMLSPEKLQIIKILSGILRIAEGIDRRKLQSVASVQVINNESEIILRLVPATNDINPDIEIWGANRRKLLLEESLNRKIVIS